jgi:hypothetical protein
VAFSEPNSSYGISCTARHPYVRLCCRVALGTEPNFLVVMTMVTLFRYELPISQHINIYGCIYIYLDPHLIWDTSKDGQHQSILAYQPILKNILANHNVLSSKFHSARLSTSNTLLAQTLAKMQLILVLSLMLSLAACLPSWIKEETRGAVQEDLPEELYGLELAQFHLKDWELSDLALLCKRETTQKLYTCEYTCESDRCSTIAGVFGVDAHPDQSTGSTPTSTSRRIATATFNGTVLHLNKVRTTATIPIMSCVRHRQTAPSIGTTSLLM